MHGYDFWGAPYVHFEVRFHDYLRVHDSAIRYPLVVYPVENLAF